MTTVPTATNDTAIYDTVIEEEDVLDPDLIQPESDNTPDPMDDDPTQLPNNYFYFTKDDFLE